MHTLSANRFFDLLLTMETNSAVPVIILRQSQTLMNELPFSVKANSLDSPRSITPLRHLQDKKGAYTFYWRGSMLLFRSAFNMFLFGGAKLMSSMIPTSLQLSKPLILGSMRIPKEEQI